MEIFNHWVIPEKIHTPTTEGMLENLTEGGLTALEIQTVGGFEPKNTSSGGNLIDFIDVSIASIAKFSEHCFAFSNFIILSKYRLLTTYILSFHP